MLDEEGPEVRVKREFDIDGDRDEEMNDNDSNNGNDDDENNDENNDENSRVEEEEEAEEKESDRNGSIDNNNNDDDDDDDNDKGSVGNLRNTTTAKRRYHTPKIFQDAITVLIPLEVTADLKIAIKNTRVKRIASIYKRFPSLQNEAKRTVDEKNSLKDDDDPMIDGDDEDNAKEKEEKQPPKKRKRLDHVPQPEQYGNIIDYIEAKYAKGVMLEEEDDAPILDDKSEGQGSVYSKDSFLDDTDLQRDVAEQVMASTTFTKLELEHEDGDFFVNVGALEVENDDYGENYDPLQDKENKTTKKRKKSSSTVATTKSSDVKTPAPKSKKAKTEQQTKKKEPTSAKSKKSTASVSSTKSKKTTEDKALKLAAKKLKTYADSLCKKAIAMIKKLTPEELPRMKTKMKVALKCPKNKKPGDDITFANPHNPGQKLRVKVPKDCFPGGTFKVTVPVKHRPGDADNEKDRNKLPRDLQEALDVYGKAYDEWCTAQSKVDSSFETFKEKQAKFDKLAKLFPKDLISPIDSHYLKQVVRRARQNKYKRSKTAAAAAARNEREANKEEEKAVAKDAEEEESAKEESEDEEELPPQKQHRVVDIPTTGLQYSKRTFSTSDFIVNS